MTYELPSKDPEEKKLVTFDFSQDVPSGDSLLSAAVTVAVVSGVDAAVSSMLEGPAIVSAGSVVQMVAAGVDGNYYQLRCQVADSSSQVHVLSAGLIVRAR